jgi:hypothetical protein
MKAIIPSSSRFCGRSDQDRPVNHEKAGECQVFPFVFSSSLLFLFSNYPVWSKNSNALKRLGFRYRNFLAQLLTETSNACTIRVRRLSLGRLWSDLGPQLATASHAGCWRPPPACAALIVVLYVARYCFPGANVDVIPIVYLSLMVPTNLLFHLAFTGWHKLRRDRSLVRSPQGFRSNFSPIREVGCTACFRVCDTRCGT